jgi:hypothetical protein
LFRPIAVEQENPNEWPYKLHTGAASGKGRKGGDAQPLAPLLLYDVSQDPHETTDLAAQQPERVAKMKAELHSPDNNSTSANPHSTGRLPNGARSAGTWRPASARSSA